MSDDIVSRIRKCLAVGAKPEHGCIVIRFHYISTVAEWKSDVEIMDDAADEIERLRAERDSLRRQLDQFVGEFKDEVQREAL